MKKPISIILSSLMLASALASCAPAQEKLDPAITLASSDAQTKAAWLDERLDVIPDDVVLGIGSNTAYGIDMANFEDDGYIARAIDGEVLLFGKTADGLDRAVREYAKAADKGMTAELDTVYHEGVRVEKLTIAGRDICEFTVVYNNDEPVKNPSGTGKTHGNASFAADEFIRLVAKATGVTLTKSENEVDGPMVKLDYITDGSCGDNGFSYKVENGNLYINGAPDAHGVANGVYHFLQYECGWEALMFGHSNLHEAELVAVEDGVSVTVEPISDYLYLYGINLAPRYFDFRNTNERSDSVKYYYGVTSHAHHGIMSMDGLKPFKPEGQICYTSEDNYFTALDHAYTRVTNAIAAGAAISDGIVVDYSQYDQPHYCMCKDCTYVYYKEEDEAHSGAMIRFLNRIAEAMEADGFGGVKYQTFAYYNTNKPPQTAAHPDVYVTFCTDGNCINHPMDGSECGYLPMQAHPIFFERPVNNSDFDEWIRGWVEKCENLYLWHYALPNNFGNYTYYSNLYADLQYMNEVGFKGIMLESEYNGLGFNRLRYRLMAELIFNPDLTEEEYNLRRDEIMKEEYGDGYGYVQDYIGILEEAEYGIGCFDCWGYGAENIFNAKNWDTEIFYARSDECIELLNMALDLASNDLQAKLIKALLLEAMYRQCAIGYFTAYDAGDTEMITALEEKYQLLLTYGNEIYDGNRWIISMSTRFTPQSNLADEAWSHWNHERASLLPEGAVTSAMPDEWAEWYATSETEE